jgi:hypothetical protein
MNENEPLILTLHNDDGTIRTIVRTTAEEILTLQPNVSLVGFNIEPEEAA